MMVMWEHKSMNVKELGEYLYLDSGTLTPVLKKLEQKGWLVRKRDARDERVLNVSLTQEGEELKEKAVKVPEQMGNCIKLSKEETDILYKVLYIYAFLILTYQHDALSLILFRMLLLPYPELLRPIQ